MIIFTKLAFQLLPVKTFDHRLVLSYLPWYVIQNTVGEEIFDVKNHIHRFFCDIHHRFFFALMSLNRFSRISLVFREWFDSKQNQQIFASFSKLSFLSFYKPYDIGMKNLFFWKLLYFMFFYLYWKIQQRYFQEVTYLDKLVLSIIWIISMHIE